MKKIGLAVCYDTKNYGSQLQVLATIKKIEELGYNTEIIRYQKKMTPAFIIQTIPRLFNISFLKSKLSGNARDKCLKNYPDYLEKIKIRNNRFDIFVKKYFTNLSIPYRGWETLVKDSGKNYDVFLCGSDQLWLPNNLGSHFYTLEFAPNNKDKIAYATSFGVSEIPKMQQKGTAKFLKRFQVLSTRELAGQKIIKELTGIEAKVVCDPTLLFDARGWEKLIPTQKLIPEPYVFCYFLGKTEEHRRIAEEFKKKTGLKIVSCPFLDNFVKADISFGDVQMFDMDSADFVNLIRHAEYVLTDSFHGSVFSILHHKKFLTFNRFNDGINSRNSRIDSLCTLLGLGERRYDGDIEKIMNEINYSVVEEKVDSLRLNSIEYLASALREGKCK